VFGNPDDAKARQLFIAAAGASADVERCRPILDALGQGTFVIGADPRDANLFKLLGNMMSATALEMRCSEKSLPWYASGDSIRSR
jgi:3-hydroxyisobutyrate dehydrogenase-like beta-hydroxyacid dehydrogenase